MGMCNPASFVVTKDRVYWSKSSDRHEKIIEENDLKESNIRNEIQFVRVEIVPPEDDFRKPLNEWQFRTDQDLLPEWYIESEEEKRVRAVLPEWLVSKVILPDQTVEKVDGSVLAIYGQVEFICDSAQVEFICDSAQVEYICGSAQVEFICDSAQVEHISDSAQVKHIRGSAQVEFISGSAQVEHISDSAQVKHIGDSAQVEHISGSAQVKKVSGKAVICTYNNLSPDILKSSKAVMIDRSTDTVVCYVGKDS
jgi:hypothetical protein